MGGTLLPCPLNEVSGDLFQSLDLPRSKGDTDLEILWPLSQLSLVWLVVRHRRYIILWSGDTVGYLLI